MTAQQPGNISRLRWQSGTTNATVPDRRKHLWRVLLLLAFAAFMLADIWVHNQVEHALQQIVSEDLQTILETDIAALEFWMEQEKATVSSWAGDEHLHSLTQALQAQAMKSPESPRELQTAPEQMRLRELLEPLLDTDNYMGFGIINSAGLILAASADVGTVGALVDKHELAAAQFTVGVFTRCQSGVDDDIATFVTADRDRIGFAVDLQYLVTTAEA